MTRRSLQERIERMRKKINERNGNVVIHDKEAFDAMMQTEGLPESTIHVPITTGHCCGLTEFNKDVGLLTPCLGSINPEFGSCFCSAEHQKVFESNLPSSVVETFYDIVGTINVFRNDDIAKRFYVEYLPSCQIIVATRQEKLFVVYPQTCALYETYDKVLENPLAVANRFREAVSEEVDKYKGICLLADYCKTAVAKASCVKDFDFDKVKELRAGIISPFNSPRKSKPNTPRSNKQSPRPASPSVASPVTPSVDTPVASSAFEGLMQALDDNKEALKTLGQSA
jgi:hypothetical protein